MTLIVCYRVFSGSSAFEMDLYIINSWKIELRSMLQSLTIFIAQRGNIKASRSQMKSKDDEVIRWPWQKKVCSCVSCWVPRWNQFCIAWHMQGFVAIATKLRCHTLVFETRPRVKVWTYFSEISSRKSTATGLAIVHLWPHRPLHRSVPPHTEFT